MLVFSYLKCTVALYNWFNCLNIKTYCMFPCFMEFFLSISVSISNNILIILITVPNVMYYPTSLNAAYLQFFVTFQMFDSPLVLRSCLGSSAGHWRTTDFVGLCFGVYYENQDLCNFPKTVF